MSFQPLIIGDIVEVVFPATCCTKEEIGKIKNYLSKNWQLTTHITAESEITPTAAAFKNSEFPSYSAEKRFQHLYQALQSKSKIVWCARGGYGSGDLLPFLEKAKPIAQNKIFIGFSDIVSIGSFLQQQWNWQITAAPVLLQLARGDITKSAENELKQWLFGEKKTFEYELKALNKPVCPFDIQEGFPECVGRSSCCVAVSRRDKGLNKSNRKIVDGEIIGGCLSVLVGHFGGKYQADLNGKILFLEDEGEDGERLDRYFRQIIETAIYTKAKINAIILGNFEQANIHGTPKSKNIKTAINLFVERIENNKLNIPVFAAKDKNLGHSPKMRPLFLGAPASITTTSEKAKLKIIV